MANLKEIPVGSEPLFRMVGKQKTIMRQRFPVFMAILIKIANPPVLLEKGLYLP
jgi:hypothetical protein